MNTNYPKKLFQYGGENNQYPYQMKTKIVNSEDEEKTAKKDGWQSHDFFKKKAVRKKRNQIFRRWVKTIKRFYSDNWQWLWTTVIAIISLLLFYFEVKV